MTSVWSFRDRKTRVLAGIVLLAFAIYGIESSVGYLRQDQTLYPDFFGLWTFAKFIAYHPAAQIYDPAKLFAFQRQFESGANATYPYPYPPVFLLILWPLGLLPYDAARSVWSFATLTAFLLAACGQKRQPILALACALAPATTVCLIYGQNGLLPGALMIGGMRLAGRLPLVSGVLLGAMCYKPQLGLLVPIALAAAGHWRAFAVASVTVLALVPITAAIFGWGIWLDWYQSIPLHSHLFDASRERLNHLMPTVASAVLLTGNATIAYALQALATLAATMAVWHSWRERSPVEALVVLTSATFLATPYAFIYDLPALTGAVLYLIANRAERDGSFRFSEGCALLIALMLPMGLMSDLGIVGAPLAVISLVFLIWQMIRGSALSSTDDDMVQRVVAS
jgi:hypothetical protein